MAKQLRRVHFAIRDEPRFTCLDHQFFCTGCGQRAEHCDQSDFRHAAVLPVKPVIAKQGASLGLGLLRKKGIQTFQLVVREPPQIVDVVATPKVIWPNHRMVPVNLTVDAGDTCDPSCTSETRRPVRTLEIASVSVKLHS